MAETEKIFTTKIIDDGRITIPEATRIINNIEKGNIVTFKILTVTKPKQEA